jgi:hypothetical protein
MRNSPSRPLRVFISYSQVDEPFRKRLEVHLATLRDSGLILPWDDRKILAGDEWNEVIDEKLDSADLILFLVSPDFYASSYIKAKEIPRALEKHRNGSAKVVPIRIRPCLWEIDVLSRIQGLPNNGKWVDSREWYSQDEAFNAVAEGLYALVKVMTTAAGSSRDTRPEIHAAEQSLRVYFSYAPQDVESFEQLHKYLRPVEAQEIIQIRHERSDDRLNGLELGASLAWADLIVVLLSPDFLANERCLTQVIPQALARRDRGAAEVTLLLVRDCFWKLTKLAECQVLPRDGRAVLGAAGAGFSEAAGEFLALIDALLPNE